MSEDRALIEAHPLHAARELERCAPALRPYLEANFYPADTGGGCSAMIYEFADGAFILLTDAADPSIPADLAAPVIAGLYDPDTLTVLDTAGYPNSYEALPALRRWIVRRITERRYSARNTEAHQ